MHRTLSYTKRIWKQWLFWTLSFISDFSGVTVGGTVRGDQSRKSTEVVYVTIHNEERSRYHTGGNKDWRLISVIIFVYSSSTSLFDMYRFMYDVDGVIFNQKITEKKIKKLIISKLLIRLVLSYEIFIYILKALKSCIVFGSLAGCVLDDQLQLSPDEPLDS